MSDRTQGRGVMSLSLNYPALERLLGGDSELEIELRYQIAKQFANEHLLPLLRTPEIKDQIEAVKSKAMMTFAEMCQREIGTFGSSWDSTIRLTPKFKEKLDKTISDQLDPMVRALVESHINRLTDKWLVLSEKTITRKFEEAIEKRINDGINQRLAAAASAAAK